jgi:FHS family Na+ dependent glucose MFS transporter 1
MRSYASSLTGVISAHGRAQTLAYYIAFIALGLATGILGPTLPALAQNTRASLAQIGAVLTGMSLGWMSGSFVAGRYYDRRPAHPLLAGMVFLTALLLGLTPMVPRLELLVLVFFLIGFAGGGIDVGGNILLVWVHGDRVGPRMNALHFCFGLGAVLAPLFVAQAMTLTGVSAGAYWLSAVLLVPVALFILRIPGPANPYPPQPTAAARPATIPRLPVVLIAALFFLFVAAELGFGNWIYTYALLLGLASPVGASYLTSVFWAALALGRLLTIPLAARVRPRHLLAADIVGIGLCMGLLGTAAHRPGVLWMAAAGMGLAVANAFPTLMNLAGRHLPLTGSITRWFLVGSSLGAMTVPYGIGRLFDAVGPSMLVVVLALCALLAALFLVLFLRQTRRQPGREG